MRILAQAAVISALIAPFVSSANASVIVFANSKATCGADVIADNQQVQNPESSLLSLSSASGDACTASSRARAGAGSVGIDASITGGDESADTIRASAGASANLSYNVRLQLPEDYAGGRIPFSFNLDLAGSYGGSISPARNSSGTVVATGRTVTAGVRILADGDVDFVGDTGTDFSTFDNGVPSVFEGSLNGSFQSRTKMVDPTQIVSFSFGLDGGTSATLSRSMMSGELLAFNSLTFTRTGPVFNLPDGFGIDIPEANVFANRYFGENFDPNAIAPVPVPAAVWAMMFGLGALGALRRLPCRKPVG